MLAFGQFLDKKTIAELTARMYLDTGAVRFMTDKPFIFTSGWASPVYNDSRWLISDEAADHTGNRIIAGNWDAKLAGAEAAKKAGRTIGWPELGADAVWLRG